MHTANRQQHAGQADRVHEHARSQPAPRSDQLHRGRRHAQYAAAQVLRHRLIHDRSHEGVEHTEGETLCTDRTDDARQRLRDLYEAVETATTMSAGAITVPAHLTAGMDDQLEMER